MRKWVKAAPWTLAGAIVFGLANVWYRSASLSVTTKGQGGPSNMGFFDSNFFWFVLLAMAIIAFQTIINYQKSKYDSNLALKYQDVWESEELCKSRAEAAQQFKTYKEYNSTTKEVEIVLDIFEDIGFYVMHDEISAEVAHHHFYHWARGYIQSASKYIEDYRRDDPTTYEHCQYLLTELTKIEAKKSKVHASTLILNPEEITEFIEEEIGMKPENGPQVVAISK